MLVFFLSFSVLILPFLSFSVLILPLLSFSVLILPLLDLSFSLNSFSVLGIFFNDETMFFMIYMSVLVFFISFFFSPISNLVSNLCFLMMIFFSYFVFSSANLFLLYLSYECSLIPIIIVILKWGLYPERSFSAFLMLIYTSVFTLPFMYFLLVFYQNGYTFSLLPFSGESMSVFSTILFFLVFGVKLPIYGLHFWLPMAHVEAPTFGSIILAGVLLKLGGVGLIRVLPFLNMFILKYFVLSYLIFFTIYTILVCCSQSDFKRLVAYSSVSHMMIIPLLLLTNNYLSMKMILVSMFFHGLSSPLMFVLVGIFYSLFSSRQLVFIRGLLLLSPLLSFLVVISFFISISAPPFPSFISEVYSFISIYSVTFYSFILFILVPFFSLIYNMIWFSSVSFSSVPLVFANSFSFLTYKHLFAVCFIIFMFVPSSLIFMFVWFFIYYKLMKLLEL